ncbi:hypothetical protein CDV31_008734 [Fusarium ambrosium]|uniref:Uncharacterized protein n=1 Tax=Fusarium ambrosium TaxID=131363 RepID=A0A428TYT8_9HYPO|nr:hypothetical protein CDV31_008734 [Fusarium ambrosium]
MLLLLSWQMVIRIVRVHKALKITNAFLPSFIFTTWVYSIQKYHRPPNLQTNSTPRTKPTGAFSALI